MKIERREYPRFPCNIPVWVTLDKNTAQWPMEMVDVSIQGVRLKSQKNLDRIKEKENLIITMEYKVGGSPFSFPGNIVHKFKLNNELVFGIKIHQLDLESEKIWNDFVSSIRKRFES